MVFLQSPTIILQKYTPLARLLAVHTATCFPAGYTWSVTVVTFWPRILKTWIVTRDCAGTEKAMFVVGLNGFG